ncbi:MAG: phytoene desaturase [Planctomyces sp.]|nr:phytoene desaturase [Planctomyces sp.]
MPEAHARVLIVGGGLAGLSAAVETAAALGPRGQVTIVERNGHLGGKMNLLRDRGFSFDMGPTILTLPQVLCGLITRAGRRVEDYIDLVRLDPQWRCFYEDGTRLDLRQGLDAMAAALDAQFPGAGSGAGYRDFIAWSRRMLGLSQRVFFYKDLGSAADMMRLSPLGDPSLLRDVMAMRMHRTLASTAHAMIAQPHLRQLVEHFLQYVGSSPFLAPAILGLIASAQVDHGCWYAFSPDGSEGGTRNVARALERLARQLGVRVVTGRAVTGLAARGPRGGVSAAVLDDGSELPCDAVISNCDVQRTLSGLLATPSAQRRRKRIAARYTPACSGVVLYLGLSRRYEHLAHHNFLFSRDSAAEFDDIYRAGVPARDPTIYLAAPSRTDPTQAPPGCEALYALIHTPYLRPGQRWDGPGGLLERYRPVILDKLKSCGAAAMPDIERHIVVEHHLHPGMIDAMYNAEGGAIYGLASHGRLRGGFKPRNRSLVAPNLYLAGGSVNPGPGVPMVLMSGVTAARALLQDRGIQLPPIVDQPVPGRSVEQVFSGGGVAQAV